MLKVTNLLLLISGKGKLRAKICSEYHLRKLRKYFQRLGPSEISIHSWLNISQPLRYFISTAIQRTFANGVSLDRSLLYSVHVKIHGLSVYSSPQGPESSANKTDGTEGSRPELSFLLIPAGAQCNDSLPARWNRGPRIVYTRRFLEKPRANKPLSPYFRVRCLQTCTIRRRRWNRRTERSRQRFFNESDATLSCETI